VTDVSSEQRQKAKTAAANAAVAANDTAVVFGAAGIVVATVGASTGLGAPAGLLVGGILGVGSFAAWAIGNRYQRLANDPPDASNEVTVSGAQLVSDAVPAEEPEATVVRYVANQLILIDAVDALTTSLERFDAAVSAGDTDTASAQADAAQSNANVVVSTHSALLGLAQALNDTWGTAISGADTSTVTFDNASDFLTGAIGSGSEALATVTACVTGRVNDDPFSGLAAGDHPLIARAASPAIPDSLASSSLDDAMTALSDPLGSIASNGGVA
jgi:hypothetical protein